MNAAAVDKRAIQRERARERQELAMAKHIDTVIRRGPPLTPSQIVLLGRIMRPLRRRGYEG
jgi:hypothetical protein